MGQNTRKKLGGGVGKVGSLAHPSPLALGFGKPTGPGLAA